MGRAPPSSAVERSPSTPPAIVGRVTGDEGIAGVRSAGHRMSGEKSRRHSNGRGLTTGSSLKWPQTGCCLQLADLRPPLGLRNQLHEQRHRLDKPCDRSLEPSTDNHSLSMGRHESVLSLPTGGSLQSIAREDLPRAGVRQPMQGSGSGPHDLVPLSRISTRRSQRRIRPERPLCKGCSRSTFKREMIELSARMG